MAMSEPAARSWLSGLNRWGWPFAWILLIPVVTGWSQAVLLDHFVVNGESCTFIDSVSSAKTTVAAGAEWWGCPGRDVAPTLLPGLLNLVPLFWLWSSRQQVRLAALAAATLGGVRLVVPLLMYLYSGEYYFNRGDRYGDWFRIGGSVDIGAYRGTAWTFSPVPVLASWPLWLASLAAVWVFPRMVKAKEA